jgi:hypothetical protein
MVVNSRVEFQGLGLKGQGLGFRVWGSRFKV